MAETTEKKTDKPVERLPEPADQISVTRHRTRIGKRDIAYTVTCGTMVLKEESEKDGRSEGEKARARVFFIAYSMDEVADKSKRPVTFSFNGGPGSSSVWLHFGVLGPRRVDLDAEGHASPPPGRLVDNEFSLLDVSDLVFIDPVGTGFSRMVEGEKVKEYHEYKRDLESVGEFIRLWVSRYGRWASPKYLIGESYGTTRASGLSGHLLERYGMYLNGVMLVSCALDFAVLRFDPANDLPPTLFLPTYAATAWFHKRLPADLQKKPLRKLLDEVQAFAAGEYAAALFQGARLSAKARKDIVQRVARYTGLSPEYVERTDLRIEIFRFCKELLRDEGRTVGRLDSRYTGMDRDSAGEEFEFDPAMAEIYGPYAAAANDYVERPQVRGGPPVRGDQAALHGLGLEGLRQPLRRGGRDAAQGDVDEPAHARAGRERLFRFRDAAFRGRLLARPPGARAGAAQEHHGELLRGRAHDVRAPALAREARYGAAPFREGLMCRAMAQDTCSRTSADG